MQSVQDPTNNINSSPQDPISNPINQLPKGNPFFQPVQDPANNINSSPQDPRSNLGNFDQISKGNPFTQPLPPQYTNAGYSQAQTLNVTYPH